MSQRATNLLLALVGVLIVTALALLGYDIWRAARRGPRWKRRLVGAGLALLVSLGVVSCEDSNVRPTCYKGPPAPFAQKSAKRLREQLVLLDKLLAADKLDPAVARKVIDAVDHELSHRGTKDQGGLSSEESRELSDEAYRKVEELRQRLDAVKSTSTAASKATSLADADGWKRLTATWREASEIASGKRGAYPFDAKGKKRVLAAVDTAVADVDALAKAGLLSEAEMGLLKIDLAELKAGVQAKRPTEMRMATCYEPMMMTPARDSVRRLAARLPLFDRLASDEALQPDVARRALAAIEADHATLSKPAMIERLPEADRQKAIALRDDVGRKLAKLKTRLSPPAPDRQQ